MAILATLDSEDARLWRMCMARQRAIEAKPESYSREEAEQAFFTEYRLLGEFIEKYGVNPTGELAVFASTGTIEAEV